MPKVAQQMLSAIAEGVRFKGMQGGAKQYELERIRTTSQNRSNQSQEPEY